MNFTVALLSYKVNSYEAENVRKAETLARKAETLARKAEQELLDVYPHSPICQLLLKDINNKMEKLAN